MPLTDETQAIIRKLFPPEHHAQVATLLESECGNNLPFLDKLDAHGLERFRYASLKISDGDVSKLDAAIALAKRDWRDLLMAAGFGHSVEQHKHWATELLK